MTKKDGNGSDSMPQDLAQRIAEAMSKNGEASIPPHLISKMEDSSYEEHEKIGEVPAHLRHLYLLLTELCREADQKRREAETAVSRVMQARAIFFSALEQHVPVDGDSFKGCGVRTNWEVVGLPKDDEDDMLAGLARMMEGIVVRGRPLN